MAGLNEYVGWGLSTMALYFLNKNSNSTADSSFDPDTLNVNSNQTKIGAPVPVILGRALIKSPLVIYFGDFRADRYTETYSAHAKFNAWPLVFALIAQVLASPATGMSHPGQKVDVTVTTSGGGGSGTGATSAPGTNKDNLITPLIQSLFMWLLNWLINGRNLKTTMQKGFKYYLGYQMLVCWSGENMRIRAIYLKENKVWEGDEKRENHLTTPFIIPVKNGDLFGGVDEQGGFIGDIRVYLGGNRQPADNWMQKQMNNDSIPEELRGLTPAYRPFVSIVVPTAYIGKSATIPETWIEFSNCPNGLGLGAIGEDANPAEILYELHINKSWGLAESPELIDGEALKKIGAALKTEGIGISVQISSKTQAQNLIDNILEHINAVKYADPVTGKLTFKLIRDDYNTDELMRLDTCILSSVEISRPGWLDTVSEISVAYTDRKANYEQSTIPSVDPANIEINGGTKTTKTYSYTYFTTADNALWAAKREQYQQGYPLAVVTMEGNRHLANIRIGEVVILDWAPYGIKNMLLRITNVEHGDFVDGKIKLEALEDVFGLTKTDFGFSGSTEWVPKETYPTGVQTFQYLELPWELCNEKNTFVAAFAARPDEVTQLWTVWRQRQGEDFESTSSLSNWTAAGRLVYDYEEFTDAEDIMGYEIADLGGIADLESSIDTDIASARKGGKILSVNGEIMAYSTLRLLPNGHWYVKGILRGVYDTVPQKHAAQSHVFFIRSGFYANVTTGGPVCTVGNVVTEQYNITTSTVDNTEEFDYVKVKGLTTSRRPERPCVPGRIRLSAHLQKDKICIDKLAGNLTLSWVPRNKQNQFGCVSQDDAIEYWTKQEFTAPENTLTMIRVTVGDKSKDYVTRKIEDTSFTYSWEKRYLDFPDNFVDETRVEIYAKQGGLLSYQAQERHFKWTIPMIVDGMITEKDGVRLLKQWGADDRIEIPDGAAATQQQILYVDMPIIIIGEKTSATSENVIVCYDGRYLVPSGQIMIITGKNKYEIYNMQAGFIFDSYFTLEASGGKIRYQWDGNKIITLT